MGSYRNLLPSTESKSMRVRHSYTMKSQVSTAMAFKEDGMSFKPKAYTMVQLQASMLCGTQPRDVKNIKAARDRHNSMSD